MIAEIVIFVFVTLASGEESEDAGNTSIKQLNTNFNLRNYYISVLCSKICWLNKYN